MTLWAFVITLMLPSMGGEVKITVQTADEAGCWKARGVLMREMRDMRKTATECARSTTGWGAGELGQP